MKKIEQGKFYLVKYTDNYKDTVIETSKVLKPSRYYFTKDGRQVFVIKRLTFKYTFEDIDNVRVMMEDYDVGTVQHNLCMRMVKAFNQPTPAVRFSQEEREILSYIYWENHNIRESDKKTLRKILGIKE